MTGVRTLYRLKDYKKVYVRLADEGGAAAEGADAKEQLR